MAKKDNTIFLIVGIVLVILLINYYKVQLEEGMIGLTPHYYKDGVEIFPQKTFFGFSIVTPPGGSFDQISFDVYGTNEGDVPITTIRPIDAYPQIFKDALPNQYPATYRTLEVGEINKLLWSTSLIDTADFEAISPVNFWIDVRGKYSGKYFYADRRYSGEISFEFEGCISTTVMSYCAPGTPMISGGFIYDESNQPYPVGTEIYFTDSDCKKIRMQEDDGFGNYYLVYPSFFDVTFRGCYMSSSDILHLHINDEYTGVSFNWEDFGGGDGSVGSCTIDCSGQQCGPNNCYNDVCGTCGFGSKCINEVCYVEGIGGTDDSLYCYAPIPLYEEGCPLRSDWIERVQFANIDVTTGPDYDDGYEDLTDNIINIINDDREYTLTVTLGMINDGEERCAAVWFDYVEPPWDIEWEFSYGEVIGCCDYDGCTISQVFNFYPEANVKLMRIQETFGGFNSADMEQPCENKGEIEDYSINVI